MTTKIRLSLRPNKPAVDRGRAYRTQIVGQVTPDIHVAGVQVWILAGDGLWYRQPRLDHCTGGKFNVLGFFGNPDSNQGNQYTVIALVGAENILSPSAKLPKGGVRSNKVRAFREDTPGPAFVGRTPTRK